MRRTWMTMVLATLLAGACESADPAGHDAEGPDAAPFQGVTARTVVEAPGHTGEGTSDAENAVNGVRGGGSKAGSADVFSLGFDEGIDNFVVLSWGGARVRNGDGIDFVVFENPFEITGGRVFMDLTIVLLSADGETWVAFPHDYVAEDETAYLATPEVWAGFAGRHPVRYHVESNPVDPFDFARAGGDPFDLDDLSGEDAASREIREHGFCYLKLVTAPSMTNPDTGAPYVRDPASNGADIDGVVARYVEE